jgi:hypothetical protein
MWPATEWSKTGLIDRFLDALTPLWQAQASAGLEPVFPPLAAGGDYWDTAFLEAALAGLARRKQPELMQRLTFAVNLWTFNRPADWGRGGLQSWPQAKPYLTPPGSQDQRGFHLFDWYNEILDARIGERRPLLCLAGGPRFGDQTDPALPAIDEIRHASCTHAIVQMLNENKLPENLLNVNFWLLAAPEGSPFASQAWYRPDGTTLAPGSTLKRRTATNKASMQTKSLKFEARPNGKALRHYLLLPTFEWGVSEWHWEMALDYVRQHRPVCGFSPEEAQQAQRVTIFGNEQGIDRQVEETLRRAGCDVERVTSTE